MAGADVLQHLGGARVHELARIPLRAWDRYRRTVAPGFSRVSARVRASAIHALMVEEMERSFPGDVIRRCGRALLFVPPAGTYSAVIVQPKKLNEKGMPQNYPTPTALKFDRQQQIANMPIGTRVTLGYELDARGTAVGEVRLIIQDASGIRWSYPLMTNQIMLPMFAPAPVSAPAIAVVPTKRRLSAKASAKPTKKTRKPGA